VTVPPMPPVPPVPEPVTSVPHRLTRVCWASAVVIAVGSVALALALEGASAGSAASGNAGAGSAAAGIGGASSYGVAFTPVTRAMVALFGLGCAGLLLLLTRPRLVADADGLRVRNVGRWRWLPWGVVQGVRLDDASPWMAVDLADDETVPVLAVQAADGARARATFAAVRDLHRRAAGAGGTAPPRGDFPGAGSPHAGPDGPPTLRP
jgi:hypothetical protein